MKTLTIDATGMHYTPLNQSIRHAVIEGYDEIVINHVLGQRFIADGLKGNITITINGVPGGDLGMFMSGPTCIVHGNCEHAPGNTMDAGSIVIHGGAGDAVGHSMRGGKIYIRDGIGYRGGIHMKEYREKRPILLIGENARAFLGEYMAGGLIIVMGMNTPEPVMEQGIGSGIHGGEIYIRGDVEKRYLGVGAMIKPFSETERELIRPYIDEFATYFGMDYHSLIEDSFTRIGPSSSRPFANKYTWE